MEPNPKNQQLNTSATNSPSPKVTSTSPTKSSTTQPAPPPHNSPPTKTTPPPTQPSNPTPEPPPQNIHLQTDQSQPEHQTTTDPPQQRTGAVIVPTVASNDAASVEPESVAEPASTALKRKRTKVMARKAPKAKLVDVQEELINEEEGLGAKEEPAL